MALGPRLDLRQSQSLVMTPQLQQAIRLLALSNLEIEAFIGEALEANPLLDMGEVRREDTPEPRESPPDEPSADTGAGDDSALDIDAAALDRDRDTGDGEWSSAHASAGDEGPSIDERGGDAPTLA
ncbi:MAG: RNA polymerase factor sigma-54, partial [Tsuneonella sp.]